MAQTTSVNLAPMLPYLWELLNKGKTGGQMEAAESLQMPEYSPFVDPAVTQGLREKVLLKQQEKEAKPYLQGLSDTFKAGFDDDPVYQADAQAQLAEYAQKFPNNSLLTTAAKDASTKLSDGLVAADAARDMQKNGYIEPMTLAKIASQKDGNTYLERLTSMNKQQEEALKARGEQAWLLSQMQNTDDPRIQKLLNVQYGVGSDKVKTIGDVLGHTVDLKPVETGTGKGEQRQQVKFNPRTGQVMGRIGEPWMPSAPKITNILNAGEKSFQTEMGVQNARLVAEANKEASALQEPKMLYNQLNALNKQYSTGRKAVAEQKINEMLDYVGLSDSKSLPWAQKYDAIAERIVLGIGGSVLKGSQTEREWDNIRKTTAGIKNTQKANQYLITEGLKMVQRAEQRAARAAAATKANPYDPAMGLNIAVAPENERSGSLQDAAAAELERRRKR